MWQRCAPYLLPGELAIARASVLVGFGCDVGEALRRLAGFTWRWQASDLSIGDLRSEDFETRVVVVPYPRSSRWTAGQHALTHYIRRGRGLMQNAPSA
jgi:hypothetical protein